MVPNDADLSRERGANERGAEDARDDVQGAVGTASKAFMTMMVVTMPMTYPMATALKYVGTALPSCLAVRAVADFLDADLVELFSARRRLGARCPFSKSSRRRDPG